jgi:hypothetical protein
LSANGYSPGEAPLSIRHSLHAGNQDENWKQMMQIGEPLRTTVVEPIEFPVEKLLRN